MENMASDLAKTYLEKLIDGAISESRYLFCMPRIEKEYEKERDRLEAERTTIRERVNVATRRGYEIQANVRHWEEEVDGLMGEDENAAQTKHKCFCGICPNCVWRYKRGKELANKTEQIKLLIEKGEKLENVGVPSQLPGIERYSSQYYIPFESRESKYKELLDALKDDSNYIVGLQGMGGTGKTTLAKEVGKELKQSEEFSKVIVTVVSCTPDIKKIQDDIVGQLGLEWGENCNQSDRPGKLWKRLTDGEKILVILDDVWDQDPPLDFEAIGIPKQDKHGGCKLLVTTRTRQILIDVDCNKIIELEQISEDEAWIMFKRYAGINNKDMSESFIEMGRKIVEECKRLPVAISVIASSLKGKHNRLEVWITTLNSLKNHVFMQGVDEERVGIYKYLKPSYDNMRDEKAKGLFLLCSLFPEDEEISIEILTRLGIGAGLFGEHYGRYVDARNKVVKTIDILLDSCLLLDAGEGCVKMHDLVRDAARWMKKEEIRAIDLSHGDPNLLVEKENNTTTKYMLCEGNVIDVLHSRFGGSNLDILITMLNKDVNHDYVQVEVPNSMFENIARLRALFIQNEWNPFHRHALSFPKPIQSLTHIRSLIVDGVDLGDISVLGNLQSLETLDLVKCAIDELPHEITKLKKFKLLKLDRCEIRRNNPFEVIGRCSSLEELYFGNSFNSFCHEIIFPKLQRYHIYNHAWDLRNKSGSKCLAFRGYGNAGFFSEATIKYCMEKTEILCLKGTKWVWRNLIPEIVPIDKGMNDLVHLHLQGISQLQCLIDFNDSNLPNVMSKLVVLKLYELQDLEELCNGALSFDSLKHLEKLKIQKCNHLQSLFKYKLNLCNLKIMKLVKCPMLVSLSTLRNLVLLEEMVIEDCEQLENLIIVDDDDERREQDEFGEVVVDRDNRNESHGSIMFQKLKLLFIHGCPLLKCILPFLSDRDLPVLETINIERCHGLEYIFRKEVKLGSLQTLILIELPNFINMFRKCCLPISSPKKGLASTSMPQTKSHPIICTSFSWANICCYVKNNKHKLKTTTSIKFQDLPHDCSVPLESNSYRLHTWEIAQYLPIHILCNITKIKLSHFSKIKSVFILSIASRLMMLESLTIKECHELKHIIIDTGEDNSGKNWANFFPKLKELHVENCGQLEYIFGDNAVDYQNDSQIQLHLPVLKDLKLCKLPSLVAVCPKNYLTTFPSLSEVVLNECFQFAVNTDFVSHSIPDAIDNTTIKESNSYLLHSWERAQCLLIQPHIMCNITRIKLSHLSKIKSMFILFVASRLKMLESLTIMECHELKHIIIETGEDNSGNNWANVFPKLEEFRVENCEKLEYIFGHSIDYQNDSQIHLHLPELKHLELCKLPSLVVVCPKNYITTFPSLAELVLNECSQFAISTDFVSHSIPDAIDNTITKESNSYLLQSWERAQCLLIQPHIMCNITRIKLSHLSKIKSVFILFVASRLKMLESLTIMECHELKHIIIETGEDNSGNNWANVFPKLEKLRVENCEKLEYIFGHYAVDYQNDSQIQLHLPVLKCLNLWKLPSLVAVCPKTYITTFPSLVEVVLNECSEFAINSISDLVAHPIQESIDNTTIKEWSGDVDYFCALERLWIINIQVENVFCLNEKCEEKVNLGLKDILLCDLPVMKYIFVGPINYVVTLQNLMMIHINRCDKLDIIFTTCVIRCLPQLYSLSIEECKELKHIIEEDAVEGQKIPTSHSLKTCFPKLRLLRIVKCNKLKYVFPVSICKRLPELQSLIIREAHELEEIFTSTEGDYKIEIPNLKVVAFEDLPSIWQGQGIQFQAVENRLFRNCPKLSQTSASTPSLERHLRIIFMGYAVGSELSGQLERIREDSEKQDTCGENPSIGSNIATIEEEDDKLVSSPIQNEQTIEAEHELVAGLEVPSMANLPTIFKASENEQSMDKQCPLGETDTTVAASQRNYNNGLKEIEDQSFQEDQSIQGLKEIEDQTITSKQKDDGNGQKAMPSFSAKEDINIRGTQKSIETRKQEPKPFLKIPSAHASQSPSIPSEDTIVAAEDEEVSENKLISSPVLKEIEDQSIEEDSASEQIITSKQKDDGNGQKAMPSFSSAKEDVDVRGTQKSIDAYDEVSFNDRVAVKMSSVIEDQLSISKDHGKRVLESKSSLSIPSVFSSQSPSIPSEGNPSQIVEDLGSSSLIFRELEQLVFNKQLASENVSLLTDFLVKHPSIRLTNNSLTNKYKGYAYNCLAELLKFLQTHSVLDVLGSNHSEFVELLQDMRLLAFDKEWLDGVERRVLFHGLQVSQDQDVLQKLLHSKQQVTKEVEMLHLKIGFVTQQLEDLKHQLESSEAILESITKQEEQVLKARAALSTPLGY